MTDWTSWQEILWSVPTDLGWRWYAIWGALGGTASVLIFVVAIMPTSALSLMLLARVVFCIGAALIPMAAINSGWQPWIPVFYAGSAAIGALSLTIERCDDGRPITVLAAVLARLKAIGPRPKV